MTRLLTYVALVMALGLSALAATTTVVINGKAVTVSAIEANGKAFVDVVALMKLLGGTATFDAAAHKVVITDPGQGGQGAPGTAELAGDNGVFNKVYSLRKGNPLYFNLLNAEYTTRQVIIGDDYYVPKADEKLLVLHFTIQNPQKTDLFVRWDSLRMMAVDAMNVNHNAIQTWGDAISHNDINLNLKPAQKIEAYTVIPVPAKGIVPKLMVLSSDDNDGPVLRYDLHDKVTALTAPFADPADPTGATALTTVPGVLNTAYPYAAFDLTVEKFASTTDAVEENPPAEGERFLVVTMLVKNKDPRGHFLRWDTITPRLTGIDGEELPLVQNMLLASSKRSVSQDLKPDQEMRVRIYFTIPQDAKPQKFILKEGESREYAFEVKE